MESNSSEGIEEGSGKFDADSVEETIRGEQVRETIEIIAEEELEVAPCSAGWRAALWVS